MNVVLKLFTIMSYQHWAPPRLPLDSLPLAQHHCIRSHATLCSGLQASYTCQK